MSETNTENKEEGGALTLNKSAKTKVIVAARKAHKVQEHVLDLTTGKIRTHTYTKKELTKYNEEHTPKEETNETD